MAEPLLMSSGRDHFRALAANRGGGAEVSELVGATPGPGDHAERREGQPEQQQAVGALRHSQHAGQSDS
jgi:hypothetical protein